MTTWYDYKERGVCLRGSHLLRISARPLNLYHKLHHKSPPPPLPLQDPHYDPESSLTPFNSNFQHADLHKCEARWKGPGSESDWSGIARGLWWLCSALRDKRGGCHGPGTPTITLTSTTSHPPYIPSNFTDH